MLAPEGNVRKDTGRQWRAHSGSDDLKEFKCCCCSVNQSCPTLWDPMGCSMPGFLSFTISRSLLKLGRIESMEPPNRLKEIFTKARSEGSGATGMVQHLWVATSGLPDTSGPEGQGVGVVLKPDWRGQLGWGCDLQWGCSLNMGAGETSPQNFSPFRLLFRRKSLLDDLPGSQKQKSHYGS